MLQTFKLFKLARWPEPPPVIPDSVRHLELMACPGLTSLDGLEHLAQLEVLRLGMCPDLTRISVRWFPSLQDLSLVDLAVTALDDLDCAPRLRQVYLSGLGQLERIGTTGRTQQALRKLRVCRCLVLRDISGLASFVGLERLVLDQLPRIDDLRPITGLRHISDLRIDGCESITSIAPLMQMPSLRKVKIHRCPRIQDLGLLGCRDDIHVEVSR
jgi:hypothetical protein